ncbi:uncharacterized protein LOC120725437 isoform X2 [Simochromis diagramma]|nr:uncharacterized protein LOC120725437 isoform X2 [Simochromis diagramma]
MVWNGAIMENSAQAARLSLYSNCSLGIRNIVAEDAGLYWCWSGNTTAQDTIVGLHILNIAASQTQNWDGYITLTCTLFKYSDSQLCGENSIVWLNETGTVLLGSDARDIGPMCVSLLTVKPQMAHNKTYTCQYIKNNSVKIETHYTPIEYTDQFPVSYIMWTLRIGAVILMTAITVFVLRDRDETI